MKPQNWVMLRLFVMKMQWQLGTIIDLHPGEENLTRVVTLKMGDKTMKRPIAKICPLPVEVGCVATKSTEMTHIPSMKPSRSKSTRSIAPFCVLPIFTALLAIHCTVCNSRAIKVNEPFEIMNFQKPPGLYFESISNVNVVNSR